MFVRCSAALLALTSVASAEPFPDAVPGTGDDPILALTLLPEYVDAPLLAGISVRGGDPADTKVLFDGYEVPVVYFDHRALRSVFVGDAVERVYTEGTGVGYGRGTSFLALVPRQRSTRGTYQLSNFDLSYAGPYPLAP
ncbi:MAG TPA: hypothetical protein VMZ53_20380, partial [Kofleriaceae bacterium]|nr:hypothetical protein [Kofleriaceae bacterium]